jgi:hypothetical protein
MRNSPGLRLGLVPVITVWRLLVLCCLCAALLSALACSGASENTAEQAAAASAEPTSDGASTPSPAPAPAEADGSETRQGATATSPAEEPAEVAAETDSAPFFLDLETGEKTPLPETLLPAGDHGFLQYTASPDGTRIAYATCGGPPYCAEADVLTVANIDGSDARTLQLPERLNAYTPRWSPDGSKRGRDWRDG